MIRSEDNNYHLARIMLILRHFAANKPLTGLTKLAKLDFLLRYPTFTERLLSSRGLEWPEGTRPTQSERLAIESRMIRYKYGPWDDRYYSLLGTLVGLGLAEVHYEGPSLKVRLTTDGANRADQISNETAWQTTDLRIRVLRKTFNTTGTKLKSIIYEELPDVVDRPQRSEI
jgi:hypothetical protein